MHPTPHRDHPGIRDTPASAAEGLLAALGLTVIGLVILIACVMYVAGAAAPVAH